MIGQTNSKIGDKINGVIKEYVAKTDNTITKGDFVSQDVFTAYGGSAISPDDFQPTTNFLRPVVVGIDATRFVIIYYVASQYISARVGVVDNATITYQTAISIDNLVCSYISADKIDDNKILVMFCENNTTSKCVILTINGDNTITIGTLSTFKSARTRDNKLKTIGTNKIIMHYFYLSETWISTYLVATISGDTITYGTEASGNISTSDTAYNDIDFGVLETDKILCVYSNSSNQGDGVILSISGTTITVNTVYNLTTNDIYYTNIIIKDSSTAYLIYINSTATSRVKYVKITISGTTISYGTETNLYTNDTGTEVYAIKYTDNRFGVNSCGGASRYYWQIELLSDSLDISSPITVSGVIYQQTMSILLEGTIIKSYINSSGPFNQYAQILRASTYKLINYNSNFNILGVAKTGGTAGDTIKVYVP